MEARYYITISPDEELHTYTRQAEDGATVVLITAPTFEAAPAAEQAHILDSTQSTAWRNEIEKAATFSRLLKGDAEP